MLFGHVLAHKDRFSTEEDQNLIAIVETFGTKNWNLISKKMKTRNPRQYRDRWRNYLCPGLSNAPFSELEDKHLDELYLQFGSKWTKIAQFFPNRSCNSLKNRFKQRVTEIKKKKKVQKMNARAKKTQTIPEDEPKKIELVSNLDQIDFNFLVQMQNDQMIQLFGNEAEVAELFL